MAKTLTITMTDAQATKLQTVYGSKGNVLTAVKEMFAKDSQTFDQRSEDAKIVIAPKPDYSAMSGDIT